MRISEKCVAFGRCSSYYKHTLGWQEHTRLTRQKKFASFRFHLAVKTPLCSLLLPFSSQTRFAGLCSENVRRVVPFRLDGLRHIFASKAKNHSKIHCCQVQSSFAGAEKRPDDEKTAGNTLCIFKVFEDVWTFFCPSKPCVSLSTEGTKYYAHWLSTEKRPKTYAERRGERGDNERFQAPYLL